MIWLAVAFCTTSVTMPADRVVIISWIDKGRDATQAKVLFRLAASEATDVPSEMAVANIVGEDGFAVDGAEQTPDTW